MQKQRFVYCFWEPEPLNQGIFSYLHFPLYFFSLCIQYKAVVVSLIALFRDGFQL